MQATENTTAQKDYQRLLDAVRRRDMTAFTAKEVDEILAKVGSNRGALRDMAALGDFKTR